MIFSCLLFVVDRTLNPVVVRTQSLTLRVEFLLKKCPFTLVFTMVRMRYVFSIRSNNFFLFWWLTSPPPPPPRPLSFLFFFFFSFFFFSFHNGPCVVCFFLSLKNFFFFLGAIFPPPPFFSPFSFFFLSPFSFFFFFSSFYLLLCFCFKALACCSSFC